MGPNGCGQIDRDRISMERDVAQFGHEPWGDPDKPYGYGPVMAVTHY